ncbi:unnamed protein product [Mytilus edulis]|uniref:Uncharacterized protein n=1 Tax=Mytilus edulis TaxID=6550 RepID=A0A8S3UD37_MYTED|nr:unnamed protein product [Mytilus edulis]
MLPDGRMAFTYYWECKVIVFNMKGLNDFEVKMPCEAFDIVYISEDNTLAVTSGSSEKKCITIIDLEKKQIKKTISLDSNSYGIALKDNRLIYSGSDKGIRMINLNDESICTILRDTMPNDCYIAIFRDNIYHTNNETNTVTCYRLQASLRESCKSGICVTDKEESLIDSSWFLLKTPDKLPAIVPTRYPKFPTSTTTPCIFLGSVGARSYCGIGIITLSPTDNSLSFCFVFLPGVVSAICNDKAQTLDRVLKIHGAVLIVLSRKVKRDRISRNQGVRRKSEKCLSVLKSYRKTSDRIGKTLLSHCIEQHNTELVRLLVEHGARVNQIRVRLHEDTDVTIPLFHKCLCDNECLDIAKFLNPQMDPAEHKEKDQAGNTALLATIEKCLSVRYIQWLIQVTRGSALVDRNADGLTPKELATAKNNTEVIKMIDKYIIQNVVQESGIPTLLLPQFAINFCCEEEITRITDEKTKKTLVELLQDSNDKYNMKKWLNFKEVGNYAEKIMRAASGGDIFEKEIRMKSSDGGLSYIKDKYDANYRDRNGFTAMTRPIVFHKFDIIEYLCTTRPMLKTLPDNLNRYPLHYAYALPEPESERVRKLLQEKNPQEIEKRVDKDGLYPADYAALRDSLKVQQILYDARTLNVYAQVG